MSTERQPQDPAKGPGPQRASIAAALGLGLLLMIAGVWLWTRASPTPSTPQPVAQRAPILALPPPSSRPSAMQPNAAEPVDTAPLSTQIRLEERLAAARGLLHVRCFVGEEYNPVRGVEVGWYAFNTDARQGRRRLGDIHTDTVLAVHWSAPKGANSTTCVPEQPQWAHVTVEALEEDGRPARGVGVAGCGVLHETGDDGRVEFPVLAWGDPCVLDLFRWDLVSTYAQAYSRLGTLAPGETRTVTVRLVNFEVAEGDKTPKFDLRAVLDPQVPTSGVPTRLDAATLDDQIADYEDRLQSTIDAIAALEQVRGQTPEGELWLVEERLETAEASRASFAARVEALLEEAVIE